MRAAATCQTEGNGQELRREWVASGLIRRDQVRVSNQHAGASAPGFCSNASASRDFSGVYETYLNATVLEAIDFPPVNTVLVRSNCNKIASCGFQFTDGESQ